MILGCWVHALLFRRPIFSILDAVFKEGQGLGKHDVFCLSRQALNELQLLTVMAPMAHSDLRAQHSEFLFRTDASPWGGAVCKAKVGAAVAQELWRHCEQKGFYTRLESPISSILSEKGWIIAVICLAILILTVQSIRKPISQCLSLKDIFMMPLKFLGG